MNYNYVYSLWAGISKRFWAVILIFVLGAHYLVHKLKNRLIFQGHSNRDIVTGPGFPVEDIDLHTQDGVKLHSWYIPSADDTNDNDKKVVLFFHGNAGNLTHRSNFLNVFRKLNYDTLIIDYRGYGKSEGSSSEAGILLDSITAWNYLVETRKIDPTNIIIFGNSLGGGVGINLVHHLQYKTKPMCLIIQSSFSSISGLVPWPLSYLCPEFKSENKITDIDCPILIIHSPDDEIIPFSHGRKLIEKLLAKCGYGVNDMAPNCDFIEISGSHNNPNMDELYSIRLNEFVNNISK